MRKILLHLIRCVLAGLGLVVISASWGQTVWRCPGNSFTNNPLVAQAQKCEPVAQTRQVSVVPATRGGSCGARRSSSSVGSSANQTSSTFLTPASSAPPPTFKDPEQEEIEQWKRLFDEGVVAPQQSTRTR